MILGTMVLKYNNYQKLIAQKFEKESLPVLNIFQNGQYIS